MKTVKTTAAAETLVCRLAAEFPNTLRWMLSRADLLQGFNTWTAGGRKQRIQRTYLVTLSHGCGVSRWIQTLQRQQVQLGVGVVSDLMHNLIRKHKSLCHLVATFHYHNVQSLFIKENTQFSHVINESLFSEISCIFLLLATTSDSDRHISRERSLTPSGYSHRKCKKNQEQARRGCYLILDLKIAG